MIISKDKNRGREFIYCNVLRSCIFLRKDSKFYSSTFNFKSFVENAKFLFHFQLKQISTNSESKEDFF